MNVEKEKKRRQTDSSSKNTFRLFSFLVHIFFSIIKKISFFLQSHRGKKKNVWQYTRATNEYKYRIDGQIDELLCQMDGWMDRWTGRPRIQFYENRMTSQECYLLCGCLFTQIMLLMADEESLWMVFDEGELGGILSDSFGSFINFLNIKWQLMSQQGLKKSLLHHFSTKACVTWANLLLDMKNDFTSQ